MARQQIVSQDTGGIIRRGGIIARPTRREIVSSGTYGLSRKGKEVAIPSRTKPPPDSVVLGTGEYVAKSTFDKLTNAEQAYLKKFGIDRFNKEQARVGEQRLKAYAQAEAFVERETRQQEKWYGTHVVEVGADKEPILRTVFDSLPPDQQKLLQEQGVTEYNKLIQQDTRTGEQIFRDLQKEGKIDANAVYRSFDVTTREVKYTVEGVVEQAAATGEEVFAAMQTQGLISKDAVFKSYDKETGQVTFNIPVVPETAEGIFLTMQAQGLIPSDAIYKSYNRITGKIRYETPDGTTVTTKPETIAAAGAAVLVLPGLKGAAWAMTLFPEPSTTILGLAILGGLGVLAYVNRERLKDMFAREEAVQQASATVTDIAVHSSDMVVTDQSGLFPVTVQQIERALIADKKPYTLGSTVGVVPEAQAFVLQPGEKPVFGIPLEGYLPATTGYPLEEVKSINLTFPLIQDLWQPEGIPLVAQKPVVMTRFPLVADPLLQGKARDILIAAVAVQDAAQLLGRIAVKERVISRGDYDRLMQQVNEHLRQGRIAKGKEILRGIEQKVDTPEIARSYRLAYEDYLRKKAILEAARKSYVASLNPQPVKGVGSDKATATAIGIWLAIDVMKAAIVKAVSKGQSVESALKSVQVEWEQVAQTIGVTQKQLAVAADTVVYEAALQAMTAEALKVHAELKVQGLTQTQMQTQLLEAVNQAALTAVQQAVATKTVTKTQATALTKVLSMAAVNITTLVLVLRLPAAAVAAKKKKQQIYPKGSVAWKQGFIYKLIYPPYREGNILHSRKPFPGVRTVKGAGSAYKTIIKAGGKVPKTITRDMGIMDIEIETPKKGKPTIMFRADIKQETRQGKRRVVPKRRPVKRRLQQVAAA